jgi:hypothetical protein
MEKRKYPNIAKLLRAARAQERSVRRWIKSWFAFYPINIDVPNNRKIAGTVFDILLAIIPAATGMTVLWKWIWWFASWALFIRVVFPDWKPSLRRLPSKTRWATFTVLMLLFVVVFSQTARTQWREEKASVLSGELCSFRSFSGICYTPPVPIIEIADSGTKFIWGSSNPMEMGEFAHNVGFRIENGRHGIELSTPVLDRSGKKIANIEKNHWTVMPQPGIWDKNYTENALEIKDSREQVVLQIRFLSDRIQIAAEWRDQFGRGQEWSKCPNSTKDHASCISPWGSPQTELQNELIIEPIFKYPSSEYWGEFVK